MNEATWPGASSRTAGPVTRGANEPTFQRNFRRSIASTGTPRAPTTVRSLLPATARADSRNDSMTLRLAWWIAATAATPIATPTTGRSARIGRRPLGPVTTAGRTRLTPLIVAP